MCLTGFSSREKDLTIYLTQGFSDAEKLMSGLGRYRAGVGCLYLKSLEDVSLPVLTQLIVCSIEATRKRYPG